jgi:hypothetical protein
MSVVVSARHVKCDVECKVSGSIFVAFSRVVCYYECHIRRVLVYLMPIMSWSHSSPEQ